MPASPSSQPPFANDGPTFRQIRHALNGFARIVKYKSYEPVWTSIGECPG